MPFRWLKPLYCKSNALDDIVQLPKKRQPSSSSRNPSLSCHSSSQALLDVFFLLPKTPHFSTQKPQHNRSQTNTSIPNPNLSPKQIPKSHHNSPPFPPRPPPSPPPPLPTLSKLPATHSSRRIIEIIFRSSWSLPFPCHIDMLFRIRHSPLAIAAFESRRTAVLRLDSNDPRCAADGNEMLRFHATATDGGLARCKVGKMEGVRTFAGSGGAHEGCGGGSRRRGMMVCRVIVGRVGDPEEMGSGVDSVRLSEEELLVFDARAVLPCFLIIYKV
ncbi:hypothetical protein KFK09_028117 [Dendrobium nobile]|uniref:Uncharacterized protein n=1 Tax=Dendrobium nobile TaxID=94219 RepID=A0A8T3A2J8_DENNO|nr:hypothetical protein KFK09_028117 [Dendrobium nobile]